MDKTLNRIIGERIRAARTEKGLKQTDLAKKIDATAALISNIENGGQSIQLIDIYKIAALLDKEVSYFLPTYKEFSDAMPSIDKETEKLSAKEASVVDTLRKQMNKEE